MKVTANIEGGEYIFFIFLIVFLSNLHSAQFYTHTNLRMRLIKKKLKDGG